MKRPGVIRFIQKDLLRWKNAKENAMIIMTVFLELPPKRVGAHYINLAQRKELPKNLLLLSKKL